MKRAFPMIALILSATSFNSYASSLKARCPITSDTERVVKDASFEIDYQPVSATLITIASIDYLNHDESGNIVREIFHSQERRGGYAVRYCSTDDHMYQEYSKTFALYAECTAPSPLSSVSVTGVMSFKEAKTINVRAVTEDLSMTERRIDVGPCVESY